MSKISLTNRNANALHRECVVDLVTGRCIFDDGQEVNVKQLRQDSEFSHPLLTEKFTPSVEHTYHYQYDDIDGMLYSAIYVYSALLHEDQPQACQFKINPSAVFQSKPGAKTIYFSINSREPAQESIDIKQLETIIHELRGQPFTFSEDIIIDEVFTMADLPKSVNGDSLYICDEELVALIKAPVSRSVCELRYINPDLKLGVFSRDAIKKGDFIELYTGLKPIKNPHFHYSFYAEFDCLNMDIDAYYHGNMTRFINHAPDPDTKESSSNQPSLLEANIKSHIYYLNGIAFVVYLSQRDIAKGEQLLVDYGGSFFNNGDVVRRFKKNSQPMDRKLYFLNKHATRKLFQIKTMARHGVKKAQVYYVKRMLSIVSLLIIMTAILNHSR